MIRLLFFLFFVCYLFIYIPLSAQVIDPKIQEAVSKITVDGYSSHFDSTHTSPDNNRKVVSSQQQSVDHDACRNYIYRQFVRYFGEGNCYLHNFNSFSHKGLSNVIGYHAGKHDSLGVWIIGAHYDTNIISPKPFTDLTSSPGANDNESGLAAILEIGKVLSEVDAGASVILAAWDLEEIYKFGFPTGSNKWFKKFVRRLKQTDYELIGQAGVINLDDIKGYISFDMIGNPQRVDSINYGLSVCYAKTTHIPFSKIYVEIMNLYSPSVNATLFGRLTLSDHYTFASRNVPSALNLESGYWLDPYYHTPKDNNQNTDNVDFGFGTQVTRGGCAFILEQIMIID
ncbi:MAG: M28 family peptidase [Prolixibacteraceae bacterium]|jgi:hypothetical protein|nr:M28 family peptidase [Prolixibacteraceae bacterium]